MGSILDAAADALESLDRAVGKAARLPVRDRELVRDTLLQPRNHLRGALESLRRRVEAEAPPRNGPLS